MRRDISTQDLQTMAVGAQNENKKYRLPCLTYIPKLSSREKPAGTANFEVLRHFQFSIEFTGSIVAISGMAYVSTFRPNSPRLAIVNAVSLKPNNL